MLRNLHSESTNARNVEAKYPLRLYADDTDEFAVTVGALRLTHTESTAATTFGMVPAVPPPAQASKLHAAASHHAPRHTPLTDARKSSCEACQALLASWKRDVVFQNFVNAVACDVLCGLNCRDRDAKHKCDVPYRSSGKPPARRVTYPFAFCT
jgi:hypothetical protein